MAGGDEVVVLVAFGFLCDGHSGGGGHVELRGGVAHVVFGRTVAVDVIGVTCPTALAVCGVAQARVLRGGLRAVAGHESGGVVAVTTRWRGRQDSGCQVDVQVSFDCVGCCNTHQGATGAVVVLRDGGIELGQVVGGAVGIFQRRVLQD